MSYGLWNELPEGFLKKRFKAFDKLDHTVKRLIVDLAKAQNFKCAFRSCGKKYALEIEHEPGEKLPYTILNVRGLVCHRCNLALRAYEMEERGEYSNWEGGHPYLSDMEIEAYRYTFECRARASHEALLEQQVPNYWHRRLVLDRFDDWYYEGGQPPLWYRRYKEEESRKIETPEDFIRVMTATMQFVLDQLKKDPNYQPPENFLRVMRVVGPMIEEATANRLKTDNGRSPAQA